MVKTDPVILLCFSFGWDIYGWNGRKCKILKQDNANSVGTITDEQFQIDDLTDSIHDHIGSILANYRGFPMALGGLTNTKLEMFDPFRNLWMQKTDYPFFPSPRINRCISLVKSEILRIIFQNHRISQVLRRLITNKCHLHWWKISE